MATVTAGSNPVDVKVIATDEIEFATEAGTTYTIDLQRLTVRLDETSASAPQTMATAAAVNVRRTLKAGEWATICLPFAMSEAQTKAAFGDDVEIADFDGCDITRDAADRVTGITVNFTDVAGIEANHPYIIKVHTDIDAFDVSEALIAPTATPAVERGNDTFAGTYVAATVVPANALFISDNSFWYSTGATKMKAFRAYFLFAEQLAATQDAPSNIKMAIDIDGTTTAIGQMANGRWDAAQWYDLTGRRVSAGAARRGIYLTNGRKTVF